MPFNRSQANKHLPCIQEKKHKELGWTYTDAVVPVTQPNMPLNKAPTP